MKSMGVSAGMTVSYFIIPELRASRAAVAIAHCLVIEKGIAAHLSANRAVIVKGKLSIRVSQTSMGTSLISTRRGFDPQ